MNYIKMSPLSGLSGYGGGTSGLSLTAEGGADKIQIEDGGGSGRILFECTSTQVAKFDTNSRISLSNNTGGGAAGYGSGGSGIVIIRYKYQ